MRKTGVGLQSVSNGFLKRSQNALFENGNTTDAKTALSRIAPRALVPWTAMAQGAPPQRRWSSHTSSNGKTYFYDQQTGESSWDEPDDPSLGVDAWVEHKSSAGHTYFYNKRTQETQWDPPDGWPAAAAPEPAPAEPAPRAKVEKGQMQEAALRGLQAQMSTMEGGARARNGSESHRSTIPLEVHEAQLAALEKRLRAEYEAEYAAKLEEALRELAKPAADPLRERGAAATKPAAEPGQKEAPAAEPNASAAAGTVHVPSDEIKHAAAMVLTRFIGYAAAINSGRMGSDAGGKAVAKAFGLNKKQPRRRRGSAFAKGQKLFRASVHEGDIVMQGPLLKLTSGIRMRWVERYFEIRSHYLKYYDSRNAAYKTGAKPKGVIDLLAVASVTMGTQVELLFEIKGSSDPPAKFKASTPELAQQWLDACARFIDPDAPPPQPTATPDAEQEGNELPPIGEDAEDGKGAAEGDENAAASAEDDGAATDEAATGGGAAAAAAPLPPAAISPEAPAS